MATFTEIKHQWIKFQGMATSKINTDGLFSPISVDEPTAPEDELHFLKLVSWTYILFVECFPILYKQIGSTIRVSDAATFKRINEIQQNIQALRTFQGHNLLANSASDQRKISLVTIWRQNYGGSPIIWSNCCTALCDQTIEILKYLEVAISKIFMDQEDASQFNNDLRFTVERNWEPHEFDRIVDDAAKEIGIEGIDVVKYRDSRIKIWRDTVSLFSVRAEANIAVSRSIKEELNQKFGEVKNEKKN